MAPQRRTTKDVVARPPRPDRAAITAAAQAHADKQAAARDEARLPVGQLAHDTRREQRGIVMDHLDGFVWLRPVGGGTEWTALPGDVRPLDVRGQEDLLRARVARANARSRGEVL
ncbi:hypothetical protein [Streptomyces thermoalcalitolerans]|uniref:Uncharacterized protein n=1 Tax=Streptomyces thermoalcalitolerans TaxID=65605 RepID=A0ABN1NSJ8_9ACTN